jgi:hypothetical protein
LDLESKRLEVAVVAARNVHSTQMVIDAFIPRMMTTISVVMAMITSMEDASFTTMILTLGGTRANATRQCLVQ